jgi:3-deoxy-7-phosphoheptulonate synthase
MSEFAFKRVWGPTPKYPLSISYVHPHDKFTVIAGSCSVESERQIYDTAAFVSSQGATHLRGGVFRAGTYKGKSFGWVSENLIKAYSEAAKDYRLNNIIEVLDYRDIDIVAKYCTAFQVGARQQQNYTLLNELGKTGKPIFLKRNMGSTVDEWIGSAEYILDAGCKELYLIERGSSTYHSDVRWTPTLHTLCTVKAITNIPIIFDASHSSGRRDIVTRMAWAGVAAGASGILVETHPYPEASLSDAEQAIGHDQFKILIDKTFKIRELLRGE